MTHDQPIRRFEVEIVDQVPPPPKAPPLGAPPAPPSPASAAPAPSATGAPDAGRPRDFLEGFLGASPNPPAGEDPLREAVIQALRDIYDPEIPVNIYDLGLIYGVEIVDGHVTITMTLTTPHCPVAESMPGEVELRVLAVPGVASCDVNLVWDPPWNPASMSDEARLELGML